jgi:hypothetical protein
MEGRYGPLTEQVEHLVGMTDLLDAERIERIAQAYRARSLPHARLSIIASKKVGRHSEVCTAMRDMATSVQVIGIAREYDPADVALATWAAKNAGVAVATEDLIGTMGYSLSEYIKLIDPWLAGFADLPMKEREGT